MRSSVTYKSVKSDKTNYGSEQSKQGDDSAFVFRQGVFRGGVPMRGRGRVHPAELALRRRRTLPPRRRRTEVHQKQSVRALLRFSSLRNSVPFVARLQCVSVALSGASRTRRVCPKRTGATALSTARTALTSANATAPRASAVCTCCANSPAASASARRSCATERPTAHKGRTKSTVLDVCTSLGRAAEAPPFSGDLLERR